MISVQLNLLKARLLILHKFLVPHIVTAETSIERDNKTRKMTRGELKMETIAFKESLLHYICSPLGQAFESNCDNSRLSQPTDGEIQTG